MQYLISENPVLKLTDVFAPRTAALPAPLDRSGTRFFGFARAALYAGLQMLGVRPGDNILLPAFICEVVMMPLLRLGVEARFYELDQSLGVILHSAKSLIDERTKALLAVNYFGFPQDLSKLRSFCDENNLYFVEDSAHGLLSCVGSRPLGTFGDISILSIRKTLPLPNGAALIVNNTSLLERKSEVVELPTTAPTNLAQFALRNGIRAIERRTSIRLAASLKGALGHTHYGLVAEPASGGASGDVTTFDNPPLSRFAMYLLHRVDVEKIRGERRRAFMFWRDEVARSIDSAKPIFTDLPDGVVPFALPLVARDYRKLQRDLYNIGVECRDYTTVPAGSPGWEYAERVVLVPLHYLGR